MTDPLERLLAAAGPSLGGAPADDVMDLGGRYGPSLYALLSQRNGFYAFEAALHVFPSATSERLSVEVWNDRDLWRCDYDGLADGPLFFAEDAFGGQFCLVEDGVATFDPETGQIEMLASNLGSWASHLLGNYQTVTGYPLAHQWQARHGALAEGKRLAPRVPFVLGGAFDIDNLYAAEAAAAMRARGASQYRYVISLTAHGFTTESSSRPATA